jgi:hypothetical protein
MEPLSFAFSLVAQASHLRSVSHPARVRLSSVWDWLYLFQEPFRLAMHRRLPPPDGFDPLLQVHLSQLPSYLILGNPLNLNGFPANATSKFVDLCFELAVLLERVFNFAVPTITGLVLPESPAEDLVGEERQFCRVAGR